MSLAALARTLHLQVLSLQEKIYLQGQQVYSSSASPLQAPRDFPDDYNPNPNFGHPRDEGLVLTKSPQK